MPMLSAMVAVMAGAHSPAAHSPARARSLPGLSRLPRANRNDQRSELEKPMRTAILGDHRGEFGYPYATSGRSRQTWHADTKKAPSRAESGRGPGISPLRLDRAGEPVGEQLREPGRVGQLAALGQHRRAVQQFGGLCEFGHLALVGLGLALVVGLAQSGDQRMGRIELEDALAHRQRLT